jgi:hypothetical protein
MFMPLRVSTKTENTRKKTPNFSTAPAQGMFQSRPFVVQSKTAQAQPDLKTSLMRAERYGHNLNQISVSLAKDSTTDNGQSNSPMQAIGSTQAPVQAMKSGGKKRKRADAEAKEELGPVSGTFSPPDKPKDYVGTYAGQRENYKSTPSDRPVEADHMTPDTLHQPLGQARNTTDGRRLSSALPAAQIDKLLHRRKNTTGSGDVVEAQRAYLLHAHHGRVPFAGPMQTPQDHYAAATEIDLRSTFDKRAVFGEPSTYDPREVKSTQRGVVPFEDLAWSTDRIKEMHHESARQGRIQAPHATHLNSVAQDLLGQVKGQYPTTPPTKRRRKK